MAAFAVAAALLVLAVLVLLLWPLWRGSKPLAIALAGSLALTAATLYRVVGTPQALDPDALVPRDADALVVAAQARAMGNAQRLFDAEAVAMLQQALDAEPEHQRARWFLGIAARQQGRDTDAAALWEPLLDKVDAATAATLRGQIDEAREAAGLPRLPPPAAPAGLQVTVALDPDFAMRLRGDASVFVIAREPGGPPMPVAVEKHAVSELPLSITLDDADGPMPARKLSQLREVEVFARLSASGEASRQEGDIESMPVRVALPAQAPVELVIGKE